jgi:SAM-dependent methyltransferase
VRAAELANHGDPAYRALTNLVLRLLTERVSTGATILDAGCGLGYLSQSIAEAGYKVIEIDPSAASIARAIKTHDSPSFYCQTIEDNASAKTENENYGAIVANMSLHTTPNLRSFLVSAALLLGPRGVFVATIPHPCFFLETKSAMSVHPEYAAESAFFIPFHIRGHASHPERVPYFHRAICEYSEELYKAGFKDVHIHEPKYMGPGRPNDILAIYASISREFEHSG